MYCEAFNVYDSILCGFSLIYNSFPLDSISVKLKVVLDVNLYFCVITPDYYVLKQILANC